MDVFISWSGDHSRQVAAALAAWLPNVLQQVEPFVSDSDIHSGARWQTEITGKLDDCNFGVVVVTAQNQQSPWLQFEAGALSKSVNDARVVPLLVDLKKSDLLLPLNMFQAVSLDQGGVRSLLLSINRSCDAPLIEDRIDMLASKWWDELEAALDKINSPAVPEPAERERSERELLEELVTMVRAMRNTRGRLPTESDKVLRERERYRARRRDDLLAEASLVLANAGLVLDAVYSEDNVIQVNVTGAHLPAEVEKELKNLALKHGFESRIALRSVHDR